MDIQSEISGRIAAIQQRIEVISGTSATPQAGGATFATTLQNAASVPAQPILGPDGSPIQPLDPNGAAVRPLDPSDAVAAFKPQIEQAAAKYNIDPNIVQAVMQVESGGNPKAVSRAGALGLMQLMPSNVAEAGVSDPFNPDQNIDAGTRQLSSLMGEFGGNLNLALAAYNAGPNAVKRFGGIPPYPETQNYVRKINALLNKP